MVMASRRQRIELLKRLAELAPVDPQADEQLPDLSESDVALRALDSAYEPTIEVRFVREPFLRVTGRAPITPDHFGQRNQLVMSFHSGSISMYLYTDTTVKIHLRAPR